MNLLMFAFGIAVGMWLPPLVAWILTTPERRVRRVRRASLQEMLSDLQRDESTGRWRVPTQRTARHDTPQGPPAQS